MQNVTALGPANPWTANLLSALGIMHFSDEDFQETFDQLDVDRTGLLPKARVFEFLKATYGFEPMPEEMGLFVKEFRLGDDDGGDIAWEDFQVGLGVIRELLGGVAKNATEYSSFSDLRDEWYKHTRNRKDPMDKFKAPMTTSQMVGWHEEEVYNERFPKKSCDETKYADEFVRSNWDY